jgi:hypothetical protein
MYEEYQTNPNPGFDPRQKYEDAGGYLRSLLGSFLNQKKTAEDAALEQKRHEEMLSEAQKNREAQGPEAEMKAKQAQVVRFAEQAGLPLNDPAVLDFSQQIFAPSYNTYRSAVVRGDTAEKVAGINADTTVKTTDAKIGGSKEVAQINAGAKTGAAQIGADTAVRVAGMPVRPGGASSKPVNPNLWAETNQLNTLETSFSTMADNLKKSGDLAGAEPYTNLLKLIKGFSRASLKTTPLTANQNLAISVLKEKVGKGELLTQQDADDFVKLFVQADEGTGPTGPAAPQVISQDGRRFLKEGDQMYEMVMG